MLPEHLPWPPGQGAEGRIAGLQVCAPASSQLIRVLPWASGGEAEVQKEDRACSPGNLYALEVIRRALSSRPQEQDASLCLLASP